MVQENVFQSFLILRSQQKLQKHWINRVEGGVAGKQKGERPRTRKYFSEFGSLKKCRNQSELCVRSSYLHHAWNAVRCCIAPIVEHVTNVGTCTKYSVTKCQNKRRFVGCPVVSTQCHLLGTRTSSRMYSAPLQATILSRTTPTF